ncbi:NAD(P)-binding domain-containing protein [Candidatus Dormiibacter inghamiae]|uniref:flavin-containing monooxygenase n=1 Tax=Candidatus Dormiibacter inghamiae TaxID=3127013 RepID=UPI0030C6768A
MRDARRTESFGVVVVGGGQAGLAMGYHLQRLGLEFVILDAAARVGQSWREHWDSLRLFTPARYDCLPGMPFPAAANSFPTKDEMADYLEEYARRFALPVRSQTRANRVARDGDRYLVECGDAIFRTTEVVIATGAHAIASIPGLAAEVDTEVLQLHAQDYRNPAQLRPGPVLVVGAGNSGAEIAMEAAAAGHETWLAGRTVGHIPSRAYAFGGRIFWLIANHVVSRRHPLGRRLLAKMASRGGPLIRLTIDDVTASRVQLASRVEGVSQGRPRLADGRVVAANSIVWCTGFSQDFSWIDAGLVEAPGFHLVGMPFQYKLASAFVGGVGSDAGRIARRISAARKRRGRANHLPALSSSHEKVTPGKAL